MEKKESSQEKTFYQSFEDNCMISTSHKENTLKLPIQIIFNILQYNYSKDNLFQCRTICKSIRGFVIRTIKESVNKPCIIYIPR